MLQAGFPVNDFIEYTSTKFPVNDFIEYTSTKFPEIKVLEIPLMYIVKYSLTHKDIQPDYLLINICEMLIEYKADIFIKYQNGNTILSTACLSGNTDLVKLLLDNEADMEDYHSYTAIQTAIKSDNYSLIKLLLDRGSSVNYYPEHYDSLLWNAVSYNQKVCIVELLLKNKAAINSLDNPIGESVLSHAIRKKKYNIVRSLIEYKADVNVALKNYNKSILGFYETALPNDIFRLLLDNGANILDSINNYDDASSKVNKMNELLLRVCNVGCCSAVRALIDNGADIHKTFTFTLNELLTHKYNNDIGIYYKQYDIVLHGMSFFHIIMINLNELKYYEYESYICGLYFLDNEQRQPISKKIYSKRYSDIAKLLIEKGIDVPYANHYIKNGEVIYFLLEHKNKIINIMLQWMPKVLCEIVVKYVLYL
jgi:ankyrin repeat protein